MKKTIKSLLAIAISAFAFAACSDVPAPYDTPSEKPVNPHAYTGDGSVANPYTVADAIYLVQSLDGNETDQAFCVKGKVVAVSEAFNTQYGNGTFTISDDGAPANIFTAYRVYYLGNKKYTATDAQVQPGDDVIIYGKLVNYRGNTPETVQGTAFLYELNGVNRGGIDGGGGGGGTPAGTGTQTDPFNVAGVIQKCQEVGETPSTEEFFIRGLVDADFTVADDNFKNATFDIVDAEGSSAKFKAFRVLGPNASKLKAGYVIPKGATVIIQSKVVNYRGNTPETVQTTTPAYNGTLVSVNGQAPELDGGGGAVTPGTPSGTGTQADPFNVAAAVKKCQEAGETGTTEEFYVKGIANADCTVDATYKNITIKMVDVADASEVFTAFRVVGANAQKLKAGYKVNKGDAIIICGKLVNYRGNTPETVQNAEYAGTLVSVNGQAPQLDDGSEPSGGGESGGGGDVSGNSIIATFADFGFTNAQEMTVITLTDGTTLTFDAGGGTTPKYYNAGTNIRMYAKNTMTINAGGKKIASIEIACDTYNGTLCNASGDVTCDGTNMTIADASLKASGLNKASVTVANTSTQTGTPSQVRMTKLTITYQ